MTLQEIDASTSCMMVEAFIETAQETRARSGSRLQALREGVVAASMVLSAFTGMPDEEARETARVWAQSNKELEF